MQSVCLVLVVAIVIGVINIDASSTSRRFGKSRVQSSRFRGRVCFHQSRIANGAIQPTGSGLFTYTCNTGFELKVQARCRAPWLPIITCQDIDDCAGSPCLNDGTCIDGINSFTCNCPAGYTGDDCVTDIDDCADSPCSNKGTCTDGINSFTCKCPAGFTGDNCETNINDCVGSSCLNGGTCIDGINSFTCNCSDGFNGENCENKDECASSPCLNGGTCIDGIDNFTCNCPAGYTGPNCADCEIKNSRRTKIPVFDNDGILNEMRDINRAECDSLCNGNESCTTQVFSGMCNFKSSSSYIPVLWGVNDTAYCKTKCEENEECIGHTFSSTCFLYKEPVLVIGYPGSFAECQAYCLNRTDCVSLTFTGRDCNLFNKNTDNLITKETRWQTTIEKLC